MYNPSWKSRRKALTEIRQSTGSVISCGYPLVENPGFEKAATVPLTTLRTSVPE